MRHPGNVWGGLLALVVVVGSVPQVAVASVFANVAEASDYTLLYELPIAGGNVAYNNGALIPYTVDNSRTIGAYDRVAYYLELDTGSGLRYAYASMDAFTSNARRLGLPHNTQNPYVNQQVVSSMNVVSNASGVVNGTGIATGNIEMWPSNYGGGNTLSIPGASAATLDFGDGGANTAAGFGSFQVHNHGAGAAQTVLAYNGWGSSGAADSVGIGNNPGTHPDWTFESNTGSYTVKSLQVLVRETAPAPAVSIPAAPATIVSKAAEAGQYSVVYQLPIGNTTNYTSGVPYTQNNSGDFRDGSFDRLAYFLELDGPSGPQYAWVSMDNFTNKASLAGVPNATSGAIFQDYVSNMNVVSNVTGVINGTGIATGNIEFWPNNYGGGNTLGVPGATGGYDFGDARDTGGNHGSMQIHNHGAGQTIIAFNNWNAGANAALGIGNDPNTTRVNYHPDWTFATTAAQYTIKNLWVLARVAGADLTSTPAGPISFPGAIDVFTPATLSNAITLQNTGLTNSLIAVTGFAWSGPNADLFTLSNFAPASLEAGFLDQVSYDVTFLGAGGGNYSAMLTLFTSAGDVNYQLNAATVPEPGTLGLVGLLALGFAWRTRRKSPTSQN